MNKLKIAVLFGGYSSEHEISLQSAYAVITHMDHKKYEPVLIGITRLGEWFYFSGSYEKIKNNTWNNPIDCVKAIISPDRVTHGVSVLGWDRTHTIMIDAALPILHGKYGEDGTVQALLELAGIPVVGCKMLASALGMNKDKAHKIASLAGIRVPRSFTLKYETDINSSSLMAKNIGYPLFVKPVNGGSSYGITKILSESDLPAAVKLALEYDEEVIVEESIPGFEVGCSVLGNDELIVGAVDKIELWADAPENSFFDYDEKYFRATARIHAPASIPEQKSEEIKETAKIIYKALGCTGFARVDMFLTPDGEIVFNEVNTIPGFTGNSRYMNMLKAVGMTFEQVINTAIGLAVGA